MARYIDADKAMEEINRIGGHNLCEWETIGVKALIDRQPTADVAPKSEGEWITETGDWIYNVSKKYCSKCGTNARYDTHMHEYILTNFCPHCGAKMKGGDK